MAGDTEEKLVDETPLSPIERRASIEKHLQTRPDPRDLKDRHILLDTNAAPYVVPNMRHCLVKIGCRALQSTAQDLERQRATDSLKKGLEKRPERDELIERKCSTSQSRR